MRLERLEISGFMNFREPAVLDLREVPPGLVAITGANGHGKTRLLDAGPGAIYGTFFSRDGNMADYATERDAYVDALFTIEGRGEYRSRINVDGQTANRDAVLELVQVDGAHVPLNDGKVSTHRDAVATVFPPKELLLASAFAAQNRAGSFVTLGKKERKDLFGTLLGLDHYAQMCATAKTCLDVVEATRARLAERRDLLARETAPAIADTLQQRANELQAVGGQAELRRGDLQDELESLQAEREAVAEQATAHVAATERIASLRAALDANATERGRIEADRTGAATAARQEQSRADVLRTESLATLDARDKAETDANTARIRDLTERIVGNQMLKSKADEIRAAATVKAAAEIQLVELREQERDQRNRRELAQEQVRVRDTRLVAASSAEKQLATARKQIATLDTVPCGGAGAYAACAFLTHANEAKTTVPDLETAVRELPSLTEGIAVWTDTVRDLSEKVKATQIAIAQVEARIKAAEILAKYESELAATEARIEEHTRAIAQAQDDLNARLADLSAQRRDVGHRHAVTFADITQRLEQRLADLTARLAAVEAERFRLAASFESAQSDIDRTQPAAVRLLALDAEMETGRQAWTANEATLAAVGARRQELDRERQAFVAKVQERSDVEDRLRRAEDRLLVWQTFTKAFGRDGLPTLEIAAAGPTVSNLTNDLLSACFGTRFTVELVTQEERADRKGLKECFELKVFDNEHGGDARDIADLSGGERVIVDEALRAALALYVNSRNQAPIRTCWRDETTGALDPENATRYVAMLRKLHALGGFAHVLYITHNDDAAALADTRIVVTNGQPEVVSGLRRAA